MEFGPSSTCHSDSAKLKKNSNDSKGKLVLKREINIEYHFDKNLIRIEGLKNCVFDWWESSHDHVLIDLYYTRKTFFTIKLNSSIKRYTYKLQSNDQHLYDKRRTVCVSVCVYVSL